MHPLLKRLNAALKPLSEAGRLHGQRHIGREYGKRGGRDSLDPVYGAAQTPEREMSKFSLRFKFDDTVMAMAEVEGMCRGPYDDKAAGEWWDKQQSDAPGTATAAKKKLQKMLSLSAGRAVDLDTGLELAAVINGLTGNRWNVYLNGQVALDTKYAVNGGCIQKAKSLGFEID